MNPTKKDSSLLHGVHAENTMNVYFYQEETKLKEFKSLRDWEEREDNIFLDTQVQQQKIMFFFSCFRFTVVTIWEFKESPPTGASSVIKKLLSSGTKQNDLTLKANWKIGFWDMIKINYSKLRDDSWSHDVIAFIYHCYVNCFKPAICQKLIKTGYISSIANDGRWIRNSLTLGLFRLMWNQNCILKKE